MIDLEMSLFSDLIALPHSAKRPGEKRQRWTALYDSSGLRVDETNIVVAPRTHRKFAAEYHKAPERIEVPAELDICEDEVLYIGFARDHYGHFLLDSMSRMWAALDTQLPCVFLGAGKVSGDYFDEIMKSMRFSVLSPQRPTLYRKIWVPTPSLTVDRIAGNADAAHLTVTERLNPRPSGHWDQPVFLSRLGFQSRARSFDTNRSQEARLEEQLEAAGYRVVHPEDLPFAEQVALFNECPKIVGLLGSAFHTGFFSRKTWAGKLGLLTFEKNKTRRYKLIDSIKGYSAEYIKCTVVDTDDKRMEINVKRAMRQLHKHGFLD
jgi:capsular polysaccharide biosynthesis protein